jgi:hypothetical protein
VDDGKVLADSLRARVGLRLFGPSGTECRLLRDDKEGPIATDPTGTTERHFIEEYLRAPGYTLAAVRAMLDAIGRPQQPRQPSMLRCA